MPGRSRRIRGHITTGLARRYAPQVARFLPIAPPRGTMPLYSAHCQVGRIGTAWRITPKPRRIGDTGRGQECVMAGLAP
ncbi:hypothetical protein AAZ33_05695 [Edwardsiella sp. LADL05-105]|nr:hypothetical protein [Edwardsiella sp. LADL05-105]AKR77267.2 hypothetical protein AAZ33_05695 [Edwardsiella sp. LADL05-105]